MQGTIDYRFAASAFVIASEPRIPWPGRPALHEVAHFWSLKCTGFRLSWRRHPVRWPGRAKMTA